MVCGHGRDSEIGEQAMNNNRSALRNELIIAEPDGTLKSKKLFLPLSLGLPVTLPKISIRQIGRHGRDNDNNTHDGRILPAS
jgi:hypothetical protein